MISNNIPLDNALVPIVPPKIFSCFCGLQRMTILQMTPQCYSIVPQRIKLGSVGIPWTENFPSLLQFQGRSFSLYLGRVYLCKVLESSPYPSSAWLVHECFTSFQRIHLGKNTCQSSDQRGQAVCEIFLETSAKKMGQKVSKGLTASVEHCFLCYRRCTSSWYDDRKDFCQGYQMLSNNSKNNENSVILKVSLINFVLIFPTAISLQNSVECL